MPYNNVLTCHEQRAVALRGMASNESCCIAAGWLGTKKRMETACDVRTTNVLSKV